MINKLTVASGNTPSVISHETNLQSMKAQVILFISPDACPPRVEVSCLSTRTHAQQLFAPTKPKASFNCVALGQFLDIVRPLKGRPVPPLLSGPAHNISDRLL